MKALSILAVEDDRTIRDVLTRRLEAAGHTVVTAADVATALLMLRGVRFDVVIVDMNLGTESGAKVIDAAKKLIPPPRVVSISGAGMTRREGVVSIRKPFSRDELLSAVDPTWSPG